MQAKRCSDLNTLWPVFGSKVLAGVDSYNKRAEESGGFLCDVFETWRSLERQEELYAQGRTKPGAIVTWSKPGESWHFYGCAADIVFKNPVTKDWLWSGPWESLAEHMKAQGLEWLGPKDSPHFQLTGGIKAAAAFQAQKTSGLISVWKEIEKRLAANLKLV